MIDLKKLLAYLLMAILLVSCDDSDDNNPSPPPDARDKFIASWNVNDQCNKGNYVVSISVDPGNSAQVLINNFANSGASQPDTAIVAGNNIVIPAQSNSEGWLISGNGDYNVDGTISWVFTLVISGYQESCTATYSKD